MVGVLPNGHAVIHKNHGLLNGDIALGRLLNNEFDVSVRLDTERKGLGLARLVVLMKASQNPLQQVSSRNSESATFKDI